MMKAFKPGELVKCKDANGIRILNKEFEVRQGMMSAEETAIILGTDGDFPACVEILTARGIRGWVLDISLESCK